MAEYPSKQCETPMNTTSDGNHAMGGGAVHGRAESSGNAESGVRETGDESAAPGSKLSAAFGLEHRNRRRRVIGDGCGGAAGKFSGAVSEKAKISGMESGIFFVNE